MSKLLILGYGNETRGDDGIGPWVANSLQNRLQANQKSIQVLACHQLVPEFSALFCEFDYVIFIDAQIGIFEVQLKPIEPKFEGDWSFHHPEPASLLGLTGAVFGRIPLGLMVSIPASCLDFIGNFSVMTQLGAESAILQIMEWITTHLKNED